jgi:predicted RNase H-like HicB family nuclease
MSNHEAQWELARLLANRSYQIEVEDDKIDGESIIVVTNPEIRGCSAFGANLEQAIANLHAARVDAIYYLLEDGQPVPEPATDLQVSGAQAISSWTIRHDSGLENEGLTSLKDENDEIIDGVLVVKRVVEAG